VFFGTILRWFISLKPLRQSFDVVSENLSLHLMFFQQRNISLTQKKCRTDFIANFTMPNLFICLVFLSNNTYYLSDENLLLRLQLIFMQLPYCYSRIGRNHGLQNIIDKQFKTTSTFLFFQAFISVSKFCKSTLDGALCT
jgi:hypothetical protein